MAKLKALILDMDGTITVPVLDFKQIRKEIGITSSGDLAEQIPKLPIDEQNRAWSIIDMHEKEAIKKQSLQPGIEKVFETCRKNSIKIGVLTRNVKTSVDALCQRFKLNFDMIITREFEYIKPHPGPINHMLKTWDIKPEDTIMVGDYIHDIECGSAAGTKTCFFHNPGYVDYGSEADYSVTSMEQLHKIIKESLEI